MWSILGVVIMILASMVRTVRVSLVVEIDQGLIRGFRNTENKNVFAFMSVPYATAPPGKDRFKAPLPAPSWMHIFDALETAKVCPQALPLPKIREDCLIANIFVPDTNATNLPVMVYVHGGAYVTLSGDFFRYTNLVATKKVIVVTFNYRLGVHGFLCLGTKDVPGNAGMKDQVALLLWVKRNIAAFGGNPDAVTLVGCSSGSGSIDLLTLSPMATGLFNRAIIESGASLGLTGVQLDPVENAKIYARLLNFTNVNNITALEEFYKTASYELLTSQSNEIIYRDDSTLLFGPCVERDTGSGEKMFLSETPWQILNQGKYAKYPLLYGYSEMEGTINVINFLDYITRMNKNFATFLPGDLQFMNEEEKTNVANTVKQFYFGDRKISEGSIMDYVNYYTDILFAIPMLKSLKLRLLAGNETIFLYEYSFVDKNAPFIPHTNVRMTGHCMTGYAIMDEELRDKTAEYLEMKNTLRDLWLNFIIAGNPMPEGSSVSVWPPVNDLWSPYMAFNNATPELRQTLSLQRRAEFWDDIYKKYHRIPIPPINKAFDIGISGLYTFFVIIIVIVS